MKKYYQYCAFKTPAGYSCLIQECTKKPTIYETIEAHNASKNEPQSILLYREETTKTDYVKWCKTYEKR